MKTALITGSCGGIGSTVAKDLAQQGYRLILVDINDADNTALAASLPDATAITLNLTDRHALDTFCESLSQYHLDVAFINAGIIHPSPVIDQPIEKIDLQLEINLRSAIVLNHACAQTMTAQGSGHIINTVSLGAMVPLSDAAVYSATKAGLRSFLTALRSELKGTGVNVSGIYPGAVDTPMLRYEARHGGNVLNFLNTPQTPEDVLRAFNRLLKKPKLEIYVPYSDSILARLLTVFPSLLDRVFPLLKKLGIRGRQKYLASLEQRGL